MNEVGEHVPEQHAKRGEVSWGKLQYMGWNEQKVEKTAEKQSVVMVEEVRLDR
jgi:hypothetical protein